MTHLHISTIDAFADGPFTGNPAAVCPIPKEEDLDDSDLLMIAAEFNLSNTAFIWTKSTNFTTGNQFKLRWFTPTKEVPLCGHATLAAASHIFKICENPSKCLEFETIHSGTLLAKKTNDQITIDLPIDETSKDGSEVYNDVIKVITEGQDVQDVVLGQRLKMPLIRLKDGMTKEQFEKLDIPISATRAFPGVNDWFIITVKGDGKPWDFLSRFFAPGYGVDEDPVTGAAHTVLSGYWAKILQKKKLYARQCSKRGGNIDILVRDDGRVELSGKGEVMIQGTMRIK